MRSGTALELVKEHAVNALPLPKHGQGAHWRLSWPLVSLLRTARGPVHRDEIVRRLQTNAELEQAFPAVWAADAASSSGLARVVSFVLTHTRHAGLTEAAEARGDHQLTPLGWSATEDEVLGLTCEAKSASRRSTRR